MRFALQCAPLHMSALLRMIYHLSTRMHLPNSASEVTTVCGGTVGASGCLLELD